jgi:hypothetical protein
MSKNKKNGSMLGKAAAFVAGATAALAVGGYYLYGPNGSKNRIKVEAWKLKAKGEILEKIEKTENLTEEKYHQIIDIVTDRYSKAKEIGSRKAKQLGDELKKHWREIEKEAKNEKNSASKKVNSARRKIAKKINPDK